MPSIEKAANIIRETLKNLELNTVFVATDAPEKGLKIDIILFFFLNLSQHGLQIASDI